MKKIATLCFFSSSALYHFRILILILFGISLSCSLKAQVNADFSASQNKGCAPLVVTFTNLSTGSTTWNWNFGNSSTSTNQNPSTIYTIPGVYSVTLTATNGSTSDIEIKTGYIVVYNKAIAGFTLNTDTACVGQPITFTDATVIAPGGAAIASWEWDFGDGNVSTTTTPSINHPYLSPGNFPVSVITTDLNGCTSNYIQKVVIIQKPNISFSASPTSSCTPPLNVTFNNTSTVIGTTTYLWNFGDGDTSTAISPTHTYNSYGAYDVTLTTYQNGCIDSLVKTKFISIQNITASFSVTPTSVCTGDSITFTNISTPATTSSIWDFGDGNTSTTFNPSHIYTTAGTHTFTLIASDANGCSDTISSTITAHQTPTADYTADTTKACAFPFTVNFTNTSNGTNNYVWNFGDGSTSILQNPSHTYTTSGTYDVSLIATSTTGGCSDTITKNSFIIISPPVAYFVSGPDSGCVPLNMLFLDTTKNSISPITNHTWNFGDGSSASVSNPLTAHTYTATGIYSFTLTSTTANGCYDTAVCNNCIKVGIKPTAKFGIIKDTTCYGLPMSFIDSSSNATGWKWVYGDGAFDIIQNPFHVFADTGSFQPMLIAYNNGCADTSAAKLATILLPKSNFTYTLSCSNYYTVKFTSTSVGADSLVWNFGDGTILSDVPNPTHTYTTTGTYAVSLTAYNFNAGCSNTNTKNFAISTPIANYLTTAASWCYPASVDFSSTSQSAIKYYWDLGDPISSLDTSTADTAFYVYNSPGYYPIKLIITDLNNCTDTLIDTLHILGPLPDFNGTPLTGCRPMLATFKDSSILDSPLTQWIWNYGDGSKPDTITNNAVSHIYSIPGVYSVTMTVTDSNSCVKTITKNNYIKPTFPFPALEIDTFACKSDVIVFDASATSVVGGTYIWNFGDGNKDTTISAITTHSYINDGIYTVSLTVLDTNNCDSTIIKNIRILKPVANFNDSTLNAGCGTMQIAFKDSSTGYITSWNWNFGNGAGSTLQNPTYTYTKPGVYDVTLIVTNAGGCKDTLTLDSIVVVPGPVGSFSFSPVSGCIPHKTCFDASSINSENYIWDFGDGSVLQSLGDTCYTYKTQGNFKPVLVMKNTLSNGTPCILEATNLTGMVNTISVVNASVIGTHTFIIPNDSTINITTANTGGTPPYTYSWIPNINISCDTCNTVVIGTPKDTMTYTFYVYDALGCEGIDSILVMPEPCLAEKKIPNVFTPNNDGINDEFLIPKI